LSHFVLEFHEILSLEKKEEEKKKKKKKMGGGGGGFLKIMKIL
jgi:hypothetical protein